MIAIIDYGMGNLRSVQKAFEFLGCEAVITDDIEQLRAAPRLVLPGVGAFADAMERLNQTNLVDIISSSIQQGKPFLGICLGMQLLFERSYEGGTFEGLGILPGEVVRFDLPPDYKVPHMGWNALNNQKGGLFDGIDGSIYTYFVHSYYVSTPDPSIVAATADYGVAFTAAVHRDNVFATQFHPEKSGDVGLKMLKNFAEVKI